MTHYEDIEFKVQCKTDEKLRVPWEEIPVVEVLRARLFQATEGWLDLDPCEVADRYAKLLSTERQAEVRWNYAGSSQGHYVRAKGVRP